MRLKEKVVLITGAGSGIGEASARLFAQEGAWIGVLGHKAQEINAAVESILVAGGKAVPLLADVSELNTNGSCRPAAGGYVGPDRHCIFQRRN